MKLERFSVESPERIVFWRAPAESSMRAAAFLIDTIIQIICLLIIILVLFGSSWISSGKNFASAFFLLLLFLVQWGYGFFFELALSGRSPGKVLLKLRVVRLDGEPLDLRSIALRNLLRAADGLPLMFLPLLGGFVSIADPWSRRLGDIIAGTAVIHETRKGLREPSMDSGGFRYYLDQDRLLELAPGKNLSESELYVIRSFLQGSWKMPTHRAEATAKVLASKVAARLGVALEGDPVKFLERVYKSNVG